MISIEENQPFKELGLIRIKVRWSGRIKNSSHHSLKISLRENQLKMNLE
jgi:hypothetical protein